MMFQPDNRKHVICNSVLATNVGGAGRIIMPDGFSYHTGGSQPVGGDPAGVAWQFTEGRLEPSVMLK